MQFSIQQLVLWPIDAQNKIHSIPFQSGKINIIYGRSRTGKSSIISIVDYCLGASRCAIPIGIIRECVDWFGLVICVGDATFLIARRTPGNRQASNEFYLHPFGGAWPDKLRSTHNELQFRQAFNNLVRLTNAPLSSSEEVGRFEGRPSYRDLAAFNFLPQHIVANPNTLFFKADSYEHKERLKKVMPFALGIIDVEYVIKERERNQLQRQHDDLLRQQEIRRRSMASWDAEVERLWIQAVELGIVHNEDAVTTEERVKKLGEINSIFLSGGLEDRLKEPNYAFTNEKYKEAQTREENLQAQVDALRREIRGYERLAQRALAFSSAVSLERSRVINLEWLKTSLTESGGCVVCGSQTNHVHEVVSQLELEVNRVDDLSQALFENPIVDKEIEATKNRLIEVQAQLQSARMSRYKLEQIDTASKDSMSRVYVLMGRIEALLITVSAMNNTDETGLLITAIAAKLRELDRYFRHSGKAAREAEVDKELSDLIEMYSTGFRLEHRGAIALDKTELTLSFRRARDAKKEYLWEVGSGANWMGYHIATFLALHQFLTQEKSSNSPVFNFLIIDQPSQVYFPSAASGANQLDGEPDVLEKLKKDRDVDVTDTKRIFEMLEAGLKAAKYRYQIIVLEHADKSIWGEFPNTVESANWKAEDQGLIPSTWRRPNKD
jgi:Protein of unknown function (DUF3732)